MNLPCSINNTLKQNSLSYWKATGALNLSLMEANRDSFWHYFTSQHGFFVLFPMCVPCQTYTESPTIYLVFLQWRSVTVINFCGMYI